MHTLTDWCGWTHTHRRCVYVYATHGHTHGDAYMCMQCTTRWLLVALPMSYFSPITSRRFGRHHSTWALWQYWCTSMTRQATASDGSMCDGRCECRTCMMDRQHGQSHVGMMRVMCEQAVHQTDLIAAVYRMEPHLDQYGVRQCVFDAGGIGYILGQVGISVVLCKRLYNHMQRVCGQPNATDCNVTV